MHTIQPGKNTGVIIKEPSPERIGAVLTLPTITNSSSNWMPYECDGEWQEDMTIDWDTEACMTFTATNTIATYLNWLISTNQILPAQLEFLQNNGYIGADGKVSLSPRFNAALNGTTTNGNDFENVWDELPVDGVVPNSAWPMPVAEMNANPSNAWSLYYQAPPANVVALGKQFLTFFNITSRWLVSDGNGATQQQYLEWLQIAPIHLAIEVCNNWNVATPIQGCGAGAQHGVQLSYLTVGGVNNILDHYVPFDKELAENYSLSYAFQGWVTQIPQATIPNMPSIATPTTDEVPVVSELNYDENQLKTATPVQKQDILEQAKNLITYLESFINGHNPST